MSISLTVAMPGSVLNAITLICVPALLIVLGLIIRAWRIRVEKRPQGQFSAEQLALMRELVETERRTIEERRQEIISQGAKRGDAISTESLLRRLEATKANYAGPDRESFVAAVDDLAREFRLKYGDNIPVDEAYRIMKQWE
jgi:hypothetical protein